MSKEVEQRKPKPAKGGVSPEMEETCDGHAGEGGKKRTWVSAGAPKENRDNKTPQLQAEWNMTEGTKPKMHPLTNGYLKNKPFSPPKKNLKENLPKVGFLRKRLVPA